MRQGGRGDLDPLACKHFHLAFQRNRVFRFIGNDFRRNGDIIFCFSTRTVEIITGRGSCPNALERISRSRVFGPAVADHIQAAADRQAFGILITDQLHSLSFFRRNIDNPVLAGKIGRNFIPTIFFADFSRMLCNSLQLDRNRRFTCFLKSWQQPRLIGRRQKTL